MRTAWGALAFACAAPRPSPDLARAEAMERAGRVDEAAAAYDAALSSCADRARCAEIALRKGQLFEAALRFGDAVAAYEDADRRFGGTSAAARALGREAAIFAAQGDAARARGMDARILAAYPDETEADAALARVVASYEGHDRELIAEIRALHARLAGRAIDDNLLFAAAEAASRLGDDDLALRLLGDLAARYPRSGLRDDALWKTAELHHARGRHREAIAAYRRIVDTRRDALLIGSYNSQYLDDALLRIGRLWLDGLDEPARARAAFAELRDDMPWSLLGDDAQLEMARAWLVEGDVTRACGELADLPRRFPDSNHIRRAERMREDVCAGR